MSSPRRIAFLVLSILLPAQANGQEGTPAGEWPTSRPAEVGLNQAVLDSITAEIGAGTYGHVDRMLVIRHGRIAWDRTWRHDYDRIYGDSARQKSALVMHHLTSAYNYYSAWWHPWYRRGDLHSLQSVTKTVTSVVIGTALQRQEFPSIDTPVLSFFDTSKVAHIDDRKRRMTIRHLLTMTGGFDWNENLPYVDPRNSAVAMEASYDWVDFTINLPMAREPGERFNYSSGESELLAHIFHRATGVDIEEYAARHLFQPLGITRWYWKRTPAGLIDTEGGLYLEATDLARVWQLYAKGGKWNGRQVVPAEWVAQSVTPAVAVGTAPGGPKYGFKWWLYRNPVDTTRYVWTGSGFGGQIPMAFPELDMVVVFNGWNILPGGPGLPRNRIVERLVRAVVPGS